MYFLDCDYCFFFHLHVAFSTWYILEHDKILYKLVFKNVNIYWEPLLYNNIKNTKLKTVKYLYIYIHTHTHFSHFFWHLFHCRCALWDWLLHESYLWLCLRLEQNWVSNAAFFFKALKCCLWRQLTRFWDTSEDLLWFKLMFIICYSRHYHIMCSCRSRAGEPIPSRLQEEVWGSVWWRHHDAVHLPL